MTPEREYLWQMVGGIATAGSFLVGTYAHVAALAATFYPGSTAVPVQEVESR